MRLSNVFLPIALTVCLLGCDGSQNQKKTKSLTVEQQHAIWHIKNMMYVKNKEGLVFAVHGGGTPAATVTYIPYGGDIIPADKILSIDDLPD